jgi:hypothetical protein
MAVVGLLVTVSMAPSDAYAAVVEYTVKVDDIIPGGTVSYGGGTAPLIGENIVLNTIVGLDTPANQGAGNGLTCAGNCLLNFTTGTYSGTYPNGTWGPGGSFSITGTAGSYSGILFTGDFATASIFDFGSTKFSAAVLNAQMHTGLAAYFGVSPIGTGYFTEIVLTLPAIVGAFSSTGILNSDLNYRAVEGTTTVIPLPAGVWLLGIGALGYIGLGYQRRSVPA